MIELARRVVAVAKVEVVESDAVNYEGEWFHAARTHAPSR
jgi:hypothetical protein